MSSNKTSAAMIQVASLVYAFCDSLLATFLMYSYYGIIPALLVMFVHFFTGYTGCIATYDEFFEHVLPKFLHKLAKESDLTNLLKSVIFLIGILSCIANVVYSFCSQYFSIHRILHQGFGISENFIYALAFGLFMPNAITLGVYCVNDLLYFLTFYKEIGVLFKNRSHFNAKVGFVYKLTILIGIVLLGFVMAKIDLLYLLYGFQHFLTLYQHGANVVSLGTQYILLPMIVIGYVKTALMIALQSFKVMDDSSEKIKAGQANENNKSFIGYSKKYKYIINIVKAVAKCIVVASVNVGKNRFTKFLTVCYFTIDASNLNQPIPACDVPSTAATARMELMNKERKFGGKNSGSIARRS